MIFDLGRMVATILAIAVSWSSMTMAQGFGDPAAMDQAVSHFYRIQDAETSAQAAQENLASAEKEAEEIVDDMRRTLDQYEDIDDDGTLRSILDGADREIKETLRGTLPDSADFESKTLAEKAAQIGRLGNTLLRAGFQGALEGLVSSDAQRARFELRDKMQALSNVLESTRDEISTESARLAEIESQIEILQNFIPYSPDEAQVGHPALVGEYADDQTPAYLETSAVSGSSGTH